MLRLTQRRTLTLAPAGPGQPGHVSAASGLVRVGPWLHVVADDALLLATFPLEGEGPGALSRLLPGELPEEPAARKALKPDFEALCRSLAGQIPDEAARPAFLAEVLSGPASSRPSGPGTGPGGAPERAPRGSHAASHDRRA